MAQAFSPFQSPRTAGLSCCQLHSNSTLHEDSKNVDDCDRALPHRVMTKEQGSSVMAALSFGGLPLDFQVCLLVHPNVLDGHPNLSDGKRWHCCQFSHSSHQARICLKESEIAYNVI